MSPIVITWVAGGWLELSSYCLIFRAIKEQNHNYIVNCSSPQAGFNVRYWLHCQSFLLELKNLNKLCGSQYLVAQCSLFNFFLKLLEWCWRFSEGYLNNFSTELSTEIFDCCLRNFLIQEKQNGNVVSTSHWIRLVFTPVHKASPHYITRWTQIMVLTTLIK